MISLIAVPQQIENHDSNIMMESTNTIQHHHHEEQETTTFLEKILNRSLIISVPRIMLMNLLMPSLTLTDKKIFRLFRFDTQDVYEGV